jgi:hypothetical protein
MTLQFRTSKDPHKHVISSSPRFLALSVCWRLAVKNLSDAIIVVSGGLLTGLAALNILNQAEA